MNSARLTPNRPIERAGATQVSPSGGDRRVRGSRRGSRRGSSQKRRSAHLVLAAAVWAGVSTAACGASTSGDGAGGAAGLDPQTSGGNGGLGGIGNAAGGSSGGTSLAAAGGNPESTSSEATPQASCTSFSTPVQVGQAAPAALSSLSGLVASRSQPSVLFAHPDRSGTIFFAINEAGDRLQSYTLAGYTSTDLEDISVGPGQAPASAARPSPASLKTLYLGDIGDNTARSGTGAGRANIAILRFDEPTVTEPGTVTDISIANFDLLRLTYPDRPHDAESLAVDPTTGEVLIVTREADGSAYVFSAPATLSTSTTTVLTLLGQIQLGVTTGANAADISPSGKQLLIRTYQSALLYTRESVSTPWATVLTTAPVSLPVAAETQSEGVTFSADGMAWLSSGEAKPAIYRANALCAP